MRGQGKKIVSMVLTAALGMVLGLFPAPAAGTEAAGPPGAAVLEKWHGFGDFRLSAQASETAHRFTYRDKVVVLMYHHLAAVPINGDVITPARFASHLSMLEARGYHVISLAELRDFLSGKPVPDNAVLITFDDGYESVYTEAFPELAKRHMPAVSFAIVSAVGKRFGTLTHYNWDQARAMAAAGITTQSHTYDLHRFARLANGEEAPMLVGPMAGESQAHFEKRIQDDLVRSRVEIEQQVGQPVYALAWPYGRASATARQVAEAAGFRLIFTVHPGVVVRSSNPLALPRINASSDEITAAALDATIRRAVEEASHTLAPKGQKAPQRKRVLNGPERI